MKLQKYAWGFYSFNYLKDFIRMRKQTEISLVEKQPHIFHTSILKAFGIPFKNEAPQIYEDFRFRQNIKECNFFDCGEGWLSIIASFVEGMEQIQYEYDVSKADEVNESENISVFISGATNYHYRLWMLVQTPSDMDEILLNKLKVMQEFATSMSGFLCEVCGIPVRKSEANNHVKCVVCKFRDN